MSVGSGEQIYAKAVKRPDTSDCNACGGSNGDGRDTGGAIALQMLFHIPIRLGSILILVLVLFCAFTNAYKRIEKLIILFVSLIGFSFYSKLELRRSTGEQLWSDG